MLHTRLPGAQGAASAQDQVWSDHRARAEPGFGQGWAMIGPGLGDEFGWCTLPGHVGVWLPRHDGSPCWAGTNSGPISVLLASRSSHGY